MKKKFVLMLIAALLAVTPISTSMVWAEETAVDANTAAEPDVITTDTEDYRLLNEEGTVIQGDGYSMEVNWCGEEGKRIFGRTYYPADFDASKKYTTVVLNHGKSVNCGIRHMLRPLPKPDTYATHLTAEAAQKAEEEVSAIPFRTVLRQL